MELLPKNIRESIPHLYSTDEVVPGEMPIAVKFFTPDSNWSWYVVEGEPEGDDFIFYGLVDGIEREWGNFSLKQLEETRGPLGMPIERDLHFGNKKIKDI